VAQQGVHDVRPRHARHTLADAGQCEQSGARDLRGQLVVKLPRPRVDELVAGGHGERFDANKGTPMKEWFSLDAGSSLPWTPLAREALDFAIAQGGPAHR